MSQLATEFPIKANIPKGVFLAQVVAWLRGMANSTVLDEQSESDLDKETVYLCSPRNEELRFREFTRGNLQEAIGFRHDFPDEQGRIWRTEAVLHRDAGGGEQDLIRIRTQCIAKIFGAEIHIPKKPFLIKSILKDRWGGVDDFIPVQEKPHWIPDSDNGIEFGRNISTGKTNGHLPIVYFSKNNNSDWALNKREIEKIAFDLGGIAHVLAEPSRDFSFRLRDASYGTNVYGGAIGIALPKNRFIRRFYINDTIKKDDVIQNIKNTCNELRTQMPAIGWDWTELQEQTLRSQRIREKSLLGIEETEKLYNEEIDALKETIEQLKWQLNQRSEENMSIESDMQILDINIIKSIGPEIYTGEIGDRLRLAAKITCDKHEIFGLDKRSYAVLNNFCNMTTPAPALLELIEDLKRATKDPKRISSEVTDLMERHGFRKKSDNKHIRLEPKEGFIGIDSITLPKTPSDNAHGLKNQRKEIENNLGLNKIPK